MPRLAANLTFLFGEHAFLDRFAAAADAGFAAVEYAFPYAEQPDAVARAIVGGGVAPVLFNLPPGDWTAGERGLACLPGRQDDFRASVATALDHASAAGVKQLHCMAGIAPDADPAEVRRTYLDNLRFAAETCGACGVKLLIEPINTRDMPGYYLNRSDAAAAIIGEAGMPNVAILYDVYHARMMGNDPIAGFEGHRSIIGHVQIADAPDRHEPGTGGIDFPRLFRRLDELDYTGWIGCEYSPSGDTLAGLTWRDRLLAA